VTRSFLAAADVLMHLGGWLAHSGSLAVRLSEIFFRVGHLHMARDDEEHALDAFSRSMQITQRLADADPDNPQLQRGVSTCLSAVRDARAARDDPAGALDAVSRSMQITQRLADAAPNETVYQRDLWILNWRVASTRESLAEPGADEFWQGAHEILVGLDAAGELSDSDRKLLAQLTRKLDTGQ
jgi:hypothetical protein